MRSPAKPGRASEQVPEETPVWSSHDFTQWLDVMGVVSYELITSKFSFSYEFLFIRMLFFGIPYQASLGRKSIFEHSL